MLPDCVMLIDKGVVVTVLEVVVVVRVVVCVVEALVVVVVLRWHSWIEGHPHAKKIEQASFVLSE